VLSSVSLGRSSRAMAVRDATIVAGVADLRRRAGEKVTLDRALDEPFAARWTASDPRPRELPNA
jgi:hypothetical protein